VGFRDLIVVRESIESVDSPRNILRLLLQIARITFAVELLAAVALSVAFIRRGMGFGEGIFQGVFHAIMGFCNAGLVNLEAGSLIPYAGDWLVVGALALAIILGGLGFPVLVDLYRYRKDRRLTVHSRLVLITSAVLLVVGVVSVAAMEWSNAGTLGGQPLNTRIAMSVFQGVTPRTAGFFTVDYPEMRDPTLVVQTVLMFVGTAPTSTGGGIKVTTLALVFLIIVSQIRGQAGSPSSGASYRARSWPGRSRSSPWRLCWCCSAPWRSWSRTGWRSCLPSSRSPRRSGRSGSRST
jgi:trk system potassium uptake protein TrkH